MANTTSTAPLDQQLFALRTQQFREPRNEYLTFMVNFLRRKAQPVQPAQAVARNTARNTVQHTEQRTEQNTVPNTVQNFVQNIVQNGDPACVTAG